MHPVECYLWRLLTIQTIQNTSYLNASTLYIMYSLDVWYIRKLQQHVLRWKYLCSCLWFAWRALASFEYMFPSSPPCLTGHASLAWLGLAWRRAVRKRSHNNPSELRFNEPVWRAADAGQTHGRRMADAQQNAKIDLKSINNPRWRATLWINKSLFVN